MMNGQVRVAFLLICAGLVVACESFTEVLGPINYLATMDGSKVKPTSVTTDGTGTMTGSMHPIARQFAFTVGWSELSSASESVHLHGPATESGTAPILVDFAALPVGATGGPITHGAEGSVSGTLDLTVAVTPTVSGDSLRKLLDAGRVYVDVHTVDQPTGEIRGHLVRTN